jgi:hypothetical protein
MLSEYADQRMSVKTFARIFGMGLPAAKCMLSGTTYSHIERPALLKPKSKTKASKLAKKIRKPRRRTPEEIADHSALVQAYVDRRMTLAEFVDHTGLSSEFARSILLGKAWLHVKRPEGFEYPWPEYAIPNRNLRLLTVEQVREALRLRCEEAWSYRKLGRHFGVSRDAIRRILLGETYKEVERPESVGLPIYGKR